VTATAPAEGHPAGTPPPPRSPGTRALLSYVTPARGAPEPIEDPCSAPRAPETGRGRRVGAIAAGATSGGLRQRPVWEHPASRCRSCGAGRSGSGEPVDLGKGLVKSAAAAWVQRPDVGSCGSDWHPGLVWPPLA
jgi:hypothetical protein